MPITLDSKENESIDSAGDYDMVIDFEDLDEISRNGWRWEIRNKELQAKIIAFMEQNKSKLIPISEGSDVFKIPMDVREELGKIIDPENKPCVAITGLFDRGKTYI